ncbi:DUF4905 domain-containing protein [Hufsiella ginkgonis]|uniref:DUF4905 domain-containing protein n=1 Tax=Hufsiella ginkgonis TaxID=2695274 RepID=A0A7K1XWY7_9SPHI|nr:DUF4905 domain-containing protein [Hufsiella ginkgonis]MXV15523.1 DUF4905 domain-containing protein [Hufsiella ginkgonis]
MQGLPTILLHEKFSGIIWKVEIDGRKDMIAIESRDASSRAAAFSAFNFRTGHCYFREVSPEHSWWFGLDKVHEGMVFLHGYAAGNTPERKGIVAIHAFTGGIAWQQHHMALDHVTEDGLMAYATSFTPKRLQLLSPVTGETTVVQNGLPAPIIQDIRFPQVWPSAMPLPAFIADAAGPVLYALAGDKTCWAYHRERQGKYDQVLLIMKDNAPVIRVFLDENIQKFNPEAFFIHSNQLFCIRNKVEIVSYLV